MVPFRCEYFRMMFSSGFQEGGAGSSSSSNSSSNEIAVGGVSAAAFKTLLRHLYTDCTEVEDGLLLEMVKVADLYQVRRARHGR
eukprot:1196384-Prorocentrum_minimum.AAC.5